MNLSLSRNNKATRLPCPTYLHHKPRTYRNQLNYSSSLLPQALSGGSPIDPQSLSGSPLFDPNSLSGSPVSDSQSQYSHNLQLWRYEPSSDRYDDVKGSTVVNGGHHDNRDVRPRIDDIINGKSNRNRQAPMRVDNDSFRLDDDKTYSRRDGKQRPQVPNQIRFVADGASDSETNSKTPFAAAVHSADADDKNIEKSPRRIKGTVPDRERASKPSSFGSRDTGFRVRTRRERYREQGRRPKWRGVMDDVTDMRSRDDDFSDCGTNLKADADYTGSHDSLDKFIITAPKLHHRKIHRRHSAFTEKAPYSNSYPKDISGRGFDQGVGAKRSEQVQADRVRSEGDEVCPGSEGAYAPRLGESKEKRKEKRRLLAEENESIDYNYNQCENCEAAILSCEQQHQQQIKLKQQQRQHDQKQERLQELQQLRLKQQLQHQTVQEELDPRVERQQQTQQQKGYLLQQERDCNFEKQRQQLQTPEQYLKQQKQKGLKIEKERRLNERQVKYWTSLIDASSIDASYVSTSHCEVSPSIPESNSRPVELVNHKPEWNSRGLNHHKRLPGINLSSSDHVLGLAAEFHEPHANSHSPECRDADRMSDGISDGIGNGGKRLKGGRRKVAVVIPNARQEYKATDSRDEYSRRAIYETDAKIDENSYNCVRMEDSSENMCLYSNKYRNMSKATINKLLATPTLSDPIGVIEKRMKKRKKKCETRMTYKDPIGHGMDDRFYRRICDLAVLQDNTVRCERKKKTTRLLREREKEIDGGTQSRTSA